MKQLLLSIGPETTIEFWFKPERSLQVRCLLYMEDMSNKKVRERLRIELGSNGSSMNVTFLRTNINVSASIILN